MGTGFAHPYLSFSADARYSTKKYFSPQASSSGSVSAKKGWSAQLSVYPLPKMTIGGAASAEVYQTPALYSDEIIPRCRESIFAEYTYLRVKLAAKATRLGSDFSASEYTTFQAKSSASVRFTKKTRAEARYLYQRKEAAPPSYMYSAGISTTLLLYFKISVLYGQSFCSASNRVYAPAAQLSGGSIRTTAFSENVHFAALNVSASFEHVSTAVRVFQEFTFWQPVRTRTEFSVSGKF